MSRPHPGVWRRLPRGIWVLGGVSLLMDVSSEMIHSLLPLFMVTSLGASVEAVGLIEGLAEATALIVKMFSGMLSDWLGRRKLLAVCGYGLGALSKPLFALAGGLSLVVGARLLDRFGKGIRGAPRDALVADLAPAQWRGAAFGLRQSLDTVGAFAGPLLGVWLMLRWSGDFRAVFWVACVPALLSVLLLSVGLHEPAHTAPTSPSRLVLRGRWRRLGRPYWRVVGVGALFTLARFSEAFLVLRAQSDGIPIAYVPLVLVGMNVVYAASAYPFGALSDAASHRRMLGAGLAVLIAADLILGLMHGWAALFTGVALWGAHMGITQGLLARMVADTADAPLRGTAFGVFNLAGGAALLAGSTLAGVLWTRAGPPATFLCGAALGVLALLSLWGVRTGRPEAAAPDAVQQTQR